MARYLLDTHVLIWWLTDDERLSAVARDAIAARSNEIHVSAASAWEISTKARLGKLADVPRAGEKFGELSTAHGFRHLPVTYRHGLRAGSYDVPHRDPFDRMLAAQSELEGLPLVTMDRALDGFGITVIW